MPGSAGVFSVVVSLRRVGKVTFLRFKADVNLQVIHVVRQRPDTCRNHTTLNFVPGGRDPFVQRRGPQASVNPPAVRLALGTRCHESRPQGSLLSCANRGIGPPLAGFCMGTRLKLEHIDFCVRREMK